ncbi:hypothetical protein D3C87_1895780 [compost metagenome]
MLAQNPVAIGCVQVTEEPRLDAIANGLRARAVEDVEVVPTDEHVRSADGHHAFLVRRANLTGNQFPRPHDGWPLIPTYVH